MTGMVRATAPISMIAGAFVSAIAGVVFYFAIGSLASSFPIDVPKGLTMPLYSLYLASPLWIALLLLGWISRLLYRHDPLAAPTLQLHLWHCLLLYPLAGWMLFLLGTCFGSERPLPGRCADPFGTGLAAGGVALGGILANAFVAARLAARRRRSVTVAAG